MANLRNKMTLVVMFIFSLGIATSAFMILSNIKHKMAYQEFKQDAAKDSMLIKEELHLLKHNNSFIRSLILSRYSDLSQTEFEGWAKPLIDNHASFEFTAFYPAIFPNQSIEASYKYPNLSEPFLTDVRLQQELWIKMSEQARDSNEPITKILSNQDQTQKIVSVIPVIDTQYHSLADRREHILGYVVTQVDVRTLIKESGVLKDGLSHVELAQTLGMNHKNNKFIYHETISVGQSPLTISIQRPVNSVTEFDWMLWLGGAVIALLTVLFWGMIFWYRALNSTANKVIANKTQHLRFANDVLKAVSEVGQQFINDADASKMFDKILLDFIQFTQSEFGFIGQVIHDDDKSYIQTLSLTNIAWDYESRKTYQDNKAQGLVLDNPNSLFGAVLNTHKVVISNDPQADSRSAGVPPGHPQLKSFIGIPFFHHGILVGVVCLANKEKGYQRAILEPLAPMISNCGFIISEYKIKCQTLKVQALNYQRARNDSLTGLPNRFLFQEQGEKLLKLAIRKRHGMAVMYLDLDDFKPVNDKHGHQMGDELLKKVAMVLKENTRASDFVARLGGDEFALILSDVDANEPKLVAQKLIEAFTTPIQVMGRQIKVGISIGYSVYPQDGQSIQALLGEADKAMYHSKQKTKQYKEHSGMVMHKSKDLDNESKSGTN